MCFSKKKSQVTTKPTGQGRDASGRYVDRYAVKKGNKPELKEKNGRKMYSQISQTGPMEKRGCTDICFFFIFIAFVCFNFWIAFYGFTKGDPWALAQPYDVDNNACGKVGSSFSDLKYAYFFNPIGDLSATICIEKCPNYPSTPPTTLGPCHIGTVAQV